MTKTHNLKVSHGELLRFVEISRMIYEGGSPITTLKGLFELTYHLDNGHPESVHAMIERAKEVNKEYRDLSSLHTKKGDQE